MGGEWKFQDFSPPYYFGSLGGGRIDYVPPPIMGGESASRKMLTFEC